MNRETAATLLFLFAVSALVMSGYAIFILIHSFSAISSAVSGFDPGMAMSPEVTQLMGMFFGALLAGWLASRGLWEGAAWWTARNTARAQRRRAEEERFAHALRLRRDEDPLTGRLRLVGKRSDRWLSIDFHRRETIVQLRHDLRLPKDFAITHGAAKTASPTASPTGNPILDTALTIQGADGLPIRWNEEGLMSALMEVVHRFPRSRVDARTITLRAPEISADPDHIETWVQRVVTLRAHLEQDLRATQTIPVIVVPTVPSRRDTTTWVLLDDSSQ
ncbi:MAG: hypothetical protein AAFV53_12630 [Myxococcota bacterium]